MLLLLTNDAADETHADNEAERVELHGDVCGVWECGGGVQK